MTLLLSPVDFSVVLVFILESCVHVLYTSIIYMHICMDRYMHTCALHVLITCIDQYL